MLKDLQGGGFPRPIVTEKCSDLVLVEGDVQMVHGWPATGLKNLHQVLHTHPRNQPRKLTFEERVWEEKTHV
jgi:hypothetical protein